MVRLLLLDIFQWFGLLLGLTSYRRIDDRFIQTRIARAYALIINIFSVAMQPMAFLRLANSVSVDAWLPRCMWITPYVLYAVNYAVIVHTLILRGYRDRIQLELHKFNVQLKHEMGRTQNKVNLKLRRLFYTKTLTTLYLLLCTILEVLLFNEDYSTTAIFDLILTYYGSLILISSTHCYFVSLWQVARGYDFLHQQLEELISTRSPLTSGYTEELRSLWSLHASLSRTAQKINRIYGRQMLASRFDYIIFSVITSYTAIIYTLSDPGPLFAKYFGAFYGIRTLDFFMTDYICDLMCEYQRMPKDTVSEVSVMSNELSSYVIYQNSMHLNLRVCGLFPANRKQWLNMMGAILCHSIMLLQYHLMMTAKPDLQNK
ncbi:putative gustatory receptor 59b [Drosophila subobscura]|uniref:putative gustatory receptor 59b n=1 Tax=Drosophila subobscura TaxID=7241 RepID=UPI00155A05AB|nr:putative gustatory receptor 59b [Drosophila subobscura]